MVEALALRLMTATQVIGDDIWHRWHQRDIGTLGLRAIVLSRFTLTYGAFLLLFKLLSQRKYFLKKKWKSEPSTGRNIMDKSKICASARASQMKLLGWCQRLSPEVRSIVDVRGMCQWFRQRDELFWGNGWRPDNASNNRHRPAKSGNVVNIFTTALICIFQQCRGLRQ